jgi:hypothetical protein
LGRGFGFGGWKRVRVVAAGKPQSGAMLDGSLDGDSCRGGPVKRCELLAAAVALGRQSGQGSDKTPPFEKSTLLSF